MLSVERPGRKARPVRSRFLILPVLRLAALLLAVALLHGGAAHAQATGVRDFVGARAVAMSAGRGVATGNEAIFLNPAGLGAAQRYTAQLDYNHATGSAGGNGVVISVADSVSNPRFPGGVAYRYLSTGEGPDETRGWITDLAFGYVFTPNIVFGVRGSYLSYTEGDENVRRITGDVGTMFLLSRLSLGLVGYNLINVDSPQAPRGFGAGVAFGDDFTFRVAADYRLDFLLDDTPVHSYSVGGEYLLANFPLRFGHEWDNFRQTRYWSGGLGIVLQQFGIDLSYRRDARTGENLWAAAVKMFAG